MAIPQPLDRRLAEISNLASGIAVSLTTLRHCPGTDPRMVRERLQDFCDAVIDCANEIIANRETTAP